MSTLVTTEDRAAHFLLARLDLPAASWPAEVHHGWSCSESWEGWERRERNDNGGLFPHCDEGSLLGFPLPNRQTFIESSENCILGSFIKLRPKWRDESLHRESKGGKKTSLDHPIWYGYFCNQHCKMQFRTTTFSTQFEASKLETLLFQHNFAASNLVLLLLQHNFRATNLVPPLSQRNLKHPIWYRYFCNAFGAATFSTQTWSIQFSTTTFSTQFEASNLVPLLLQRIWRRYFFNTGLKHPI